jgi:hypothetical protein
MNSLKKLSYDLLIEIVAIFIGISIALYLNDKNDKKEREEISIKYFSLLRQELAKDTAFVDEVSKDIANQINELDLYLSDPSVTQIQILNSIEKSYMIPNRGGLLTSVESSNSFNSIYETTIFNVLNNTITDSELLNDIEINLEHSQHELLTLFIYPNRDMKGGISNVEILSGNLFLNELNRFIERLRTKYASLISINRNYKLLLNDISSRLDIE